MTLWAVREGHLKFVGDRDSLCDPISKPCLQPSLTDPAQLRAMAEANKELIARFQALQQMVAYANTSVPDPWQPMPSGGWGGAQSLLLTQASLDGISGKADRALGFLATDMSFWRRILGTDSGMIDEMVAVRVLASDLALLSELIAAPSFDVRQHQEQLRQMLAPLTPEERNAGRMFKREFQLIARTVNSTQQQAIELEEMDWLDRQLYRLFFKRNASVNDSARLFTLLQELGGHPPADFAELRKKVQVRAYALSEPGVTWLYNPIGKTLVGSGTAFYPDFVARVFDLAAYAQLVRAQLELRLANLAPDKVAAFLATAASETRNPYTGQLFAWDDVNRILSFEPMYKRAWPGWKFRATVPPPATSH